MKKFKPDKIKAICCFTAVALLWTAVLAIYLVLRLKLNLSGEEVIMYFSLPFILLIPLSLLIMKKGAGHAVEDGIGKNGLDRKRMQEIVQWGPILFLILPGAAFVITCAILVGHATGFIVDGHGFEPQTAEAVCVFFGILTLLCVLSALGSKLACAATPVGGVSEAEVESTTCKGEKIIL
ncbi:hypothetical protein ACJZTR_00380 [Neorickettsia risticii]|nr:hypothetical protein [Neorickettsia risticii]